MSQKAKQTKKTEHPELVFKKDCDFQIGQLAMLCQKAVMEQQGLIRQQEMFIKKQHEVLVIKEEELQRRAKVMQMLQKENEAWYNDPYIMTLLGFLGGALTSQALR